MKKNSKFLALKFDFKKKMFSNKFLFNNIDATTPQPS